MKQSVMCRLAAGLIILLALAGPISAGQFATIDEAKTYLAERGLTSEFPDAIRVAAFLLDNATNRKYPEGPFRFYRVMANQEVILDREQTNKLLRILENRRTYMPDLVKACVPSYEIGVTLISPSTHTEIDFCLSCDMARMVGETKGVVVNIDRGHNELLSFFQSIFPHNQTLKELSREDKPRELTREVAVEWAEMCIPEDRLLKQVKAMPREQLTDEILEELVNKATDSFRGVKAKPKKKKAIAK